MPAGLKQTSSVVAIGFQVTESAANTFTQATTDLNLSPLDQEVFVVLSVNLDITSPENVEDTNTSRAGSLTSTSQTSVQNLSNANCLAAAGKAIQGTVTGAVAFQTALETPPANLPYIGIIATNDFFVQVKGANNTAVGYMSGKVYGYRARADAAIYAALVQSEALSA